MTKVYWEKDIKSACSKIKKLLYSEIANHEDILMEIKILLMKELDLKQDDFLGENNTWKNKANEILLEFYEKQFKFYRKND